MLPCPICNTTSHHSIGHILTDNEIKNLTKLNISMNTCQACYQSILIDEASNLKLELEVLNAELGKIKIQYDEIYNRYKAKADLFRLIDYNKSMIKFNQAKKQKAIKSKSIKTPSPSITKLAEKLLEDLPEHKIKEIISLINAQKQPK